MCSVCIGWNGSAGVDGCGGRGGAGDDFDNGCAGEGRMARKIHILLWGQSIVMIVMGVVMIAILVVMVMMMFDGGDSGGKLLLMLVMRMVMMIMVRMIVDGDDDDAGDDDEDDDGDADAEDRLLDHAHLFPAPDQLTCVSVWIVTGLVVFLSSCDGGGDCGACLDGAAGGECYP